MSYVTTAPESLAQAADSLAGIGAGVRAENSAAAAPTIGIQAPAADQVSILTAAQFVVHAQAYQSVSAHAAAVHDLLVNALHTSSGSYAATEAANAAAAQ